MFQTNFQSDTGLFKENFLAAKSPVMALSQFFTKNARIACVLELCDETLTRFIAHILEMGRAYVRFCFSARILKHEPRLGLNFERHSPDT